MPTINIDSAFGGFSVIEQRERKASIVFVACIFDGQCNVRQLQQSYMLNKYAIHFLLSNNASQIIQDQALSEAKKKGILLVVQLFDHQVKNTHVKVRCGGFFYTSYLEPPLAELPNLLFNGTLTKLDNFHYHVAAVPIPPNFFVFHGKIVGFEVEIFRLIIARQKAHARFMFSKTSEVAEALQQLYVGQIDLFLNVLQTKQYLNFVQSFWQVHRPYCITLPKRMERMHLEVLLHPFEWQIWFVFLSVLLLMQLINLIFPKKFNHNLIMICFFGSGPSEHMLPSSARLMVCAVCIIIFLLTETYQAILLSLIASNSYMKNPETVDEFMSSNMTLYFFKGLMYMMPAKLHPLMYIIPSSISIYSMFDKATVQPCSDASFWNTNPLKIKLPARDELIALQPPIFYLPHYVTFNHLTPLAQGYQEYMDRLFEVGIYNRIHRKWYPQKMHRKKEATFNDSIVLTDDLIPVWELLGIGLLFSSIVFVSEWTTFYIRLRCIRQKNAK
ncbi:uncharacterized protein LOC126560675 [Anopheles maculipalpis]|uniref:uncharacterized protein LOC126560675 n=1 Tax=Anopheles maculipalpis TaxID=1496333 RepID=UPI002159892D|nr:uncharacterized protein LOC126560675 [Anopheles maculipalpis]